MAPSGPAPIATEALARIAEPYRIESGIQGRPAQERRAARQQSSRPIIATLEPWLRGKLALISQKSKLAETIRYAHSRWAGLARFLDDGRVEIDSNAVERNFRPIALNRKNALFAGSDGGGEHWATIASLIETCKLNGVDPYADLADVITRIVVSPPETSSKNCCPGPMTQRHSRRGLTTALTLSQVMTKLKRCRLVAAQRCSAHRAQPSKLLLHTL